MKEIKKYTDVTRFGKKGTLDAINNAECISITEKLDGANASFIVDEASPIGVACYSRNTVLTEENTLSGYWQWVKENITPISNKLNPRYRYFGEWLCKHKVSYREAFYKNFYLFSIWDEETGEYLSDEVVISEAYRLGINTVPYLYRGKFISLEHIMQFVGKSDMTIDPNGGEGVVVKNVTYRDRGDNQLFVKFISPQFSEVAKQKVHNVNQELIDSYAIIDMVVTKNRIEKMFMKLVDENVIPQDYTLKRDMGLILREMNQAIYQDILKEEADELVGISEKTITKRIGRNVAPIIRAILLDQGRDE